MATQTAPRDWIGEDDRTLATVIDVLEKQAESARRKTGGRRHG